MRFSSVIIDIMLIDTHCHIHDAEFFPDPSEQEAAYARAIAADTAMICVATSEQTSREAVEFARTHDQAWAVVGVHPHDTKSGWDEIGLILDKTPDIIGIGEIGLDYFYMNSPRSVQIAGLEQQLQWAIDYSLPVSFHVREAKNPHEQSVWDDLWPILDNFHGIRGVLHSFTDIQAQLDRGFERGLYVGVNGISTFTKDAEQQRLYAEIPLDKLLLETDAPFLTPVPFRGKVNEPSFVGRVAEHMAALCGVPPDLVSEATTDNARRLFAI